MKNFKCNNCCSQNFEKKGHSYVCAYCGTEKEEPISQTTFDKKHQEQTPACDIRSNEVERILLKLILCLLVGTFGVHKFMERQIVLGLLYLFTGGLFGIGTLIDTIEYIVKLAHLADNQEGEDTHEE